jgi:hypothetical protein
MVRSDGERLATLESDSKWIKIQMIELRKDVRILIHAKDKNSGARAVYGALAGIAGGLIAIVVQLFTKGYLP